jgi:hypothetical protein
MAAALRPGGWLLVEDAGRLRRRGHRTGHHLRVYW